MTLQDIPERISEQVSGLRDRTAEAVRADSESFFRAVAKVREDLHELDARLDDRLDTLEGLTMAASRHLERVGTKRTTWPRKMFWLLVGAGAGMAAAYLMDPDRGRSRRTQLRDQMMARARDVGDQMAKEAEMAADRTRGAAIEAAKEMMPEDVPTDPKLLEQRIKSDVFGHRDDTADVVIRVDAPGVVSLKGTVPDETSARELVGQVAEVEGVIDVTSELATRAPS